jgi:hypothetical protein
MLRLLTAGVSRVDPLYGMIRRDLAAVPRKNMQREDQVFATRLALAGPWGHVAAPLAGRRRVEGTASGLVSLLGVPAWRRHVRVVLQCRELNHWVGQSALDAGQRRRARTEILWFYARGKRIAARRGLDKVERLAARPARLAFNGAK